MEVVTTVEVEKEVRLGMRPWRSSISALLKARPGLAPMIAPANASLKNIPVWNTSTERK